MKLTRTIPVVFTIFVLFFSAALFPDLSVNGQETWIGQTITTEPTAVVITKIPAPTETTTPSINPTATPNPTPTPEPIRLADNWKNWPVIPNSISSDMIKIYESGLLQGNDPYKFSKAGDCQNIAAWFLSGFDGSNYVLDDENLQETIDWYKRSFERDSIAVRGGMNVSAVQTTIWTTDPLCKKDETPLSCEIRINNPSVMLISYEELWNGDVAKYSMYLENLIEYVLSQKIVPILATTSTNEETNQVISDLAVKYKLPVWNFWAALQPLPEQGILDGFHITRWGNTYDFTQNFKSGWTIRNETALKSLDSVRKLLNE